MLPRELELLVEKYIPEYQWYNAGADLSAISPETFCRYLEALIMDYWTYESDEAYGVVVPSLVAKWLVRGSLMDLLDLAAAEGHHWVVTYMYDKGVDFERVFDTAATHGQLTVLEELYAVRDWSDGQYARAAVAAARKQHWHIVDWILSIGITLEEIEATMFEGEEEIRRLIARRVQIGK